MFYVKSPRNRVVGESNMNKYALTLPLVIVSFLLGYFGSNLKIEHFFIILVLAAVVATILWYLLSKNSCNNQTETSP